MIRALIPTRDIRPFRPPRPFRPFRKMRSAMVGVAVFAIALLGFSSPTLAVFADAGNAQTRFTTIPGVNHQFIGVSVGQNFSLGWEASGALYAWGTNVVGQLGDGTTTARPVPTRVLFPAGTVIVNASAGVDHAVALTSTGQVYSWGNATAAPSGATPALVGGLPTGVTGISAGGYFSLAWTTTGRLYSWGVSGGGRLGRANGAGALVPALVTAQSLNTRVVTSATAGRLAGVAVISTGTVAYAWGGSYGLLTGSTLSGFTGTPRGVVMGGSGSGVNTYLIWTSTNKVFRGAGATMTEVTGAGAVAQAAITKDGTALSFAAWTTGGQLYTWGSNASGQLGLGNTTNRAAPTLVPGVTVPTNAVAVAVGTSHTLAINGAPAYLATGSNSLGQLGTNGGPNLTSFQQVVYKTWF